MNVRLLLSVGLITSFLAGYVTCFAQLREDAGPQKTEVVTNKMILEQLEKTMNGFLDQQEQLKNEAKEIDRLIINNIKRQIELEQVKPTEEDAQLRKMLEISAIEAENSQFESKRLVSVTKLEEISRQITDISLKIQNILATASHPLDSDIDALVAEHKKSVSWDGKLLDIGLEKVTYKDVARTARPFAGGKAEVVQLGALGQARSLGEQTNYCGYYAVYNTTCFAQGSEQLQERLLDRAAFADMFNMMLLMIKSKRLHELYDNLDEEDIELLLQLQDISDKQYVFIVLSRVGGPCHYTEMTQLLQQSGPMPPAVKTIADFKEGRLPDLYIIYNVGGSHGHWVAVHAYRTSDSVIHFAVVDSLNVVNWTDQNIIDERLMPLYTFITSGS